MNEHCHLGRNHRLLFTWLTGLLAFLFRSFVIGVTKAGTPTSQIAAR